MGNVIIFGCLSLLVSCVVTVFFQVYFRKQDLKNRNLKKED